MAGQFDQWGMHVNTDYLGLKYPIDSFTGQDNYPIIAHKYSPISRSPLVASYQVRDWEPGTSWEKDQFGNFPRDPIETPGERALFAILDEDDAAAFRFPVAEILNARAATWRRRPVDGRGAAVHGRPAAITSLRQVNYGKQQATPTR